jgi:hypothetical protein
MGNTTHPAETTTKEMTTYATTTLWPVTHTEGTKVITSLTTSTATITACKGGCDGYETATVGIPQYTPGVPEHPKQSVSVDVPQYTPGVPNKPEHATKESYPEGPKPTAGVPQYVPGVPNQPEHKTVTVGVDVPQYTPVAGQEHCPAPVVVTKTVTVAVDVPEYTPVANQYTGVNEYITKIVTATEEGKPHAYTVTVPANKPSATAGVPQYTPNVPEHPKQSVSLGVPQYTPVAEKPHGYPEGPKPSAGTSIPAYANSVPAPYPTNVPTPSSSKGYPVASSSVEHPAASSSAPANPPYPVGSSSKVTPQPTGGYPVGGYPAVGPHY